MNYIFYDIGVYSNHNNWYVPSENVTFTLGYDATLLSSTSTGIVISNSISSANRYLSTSSDFTIEFDVVSFTGSSMLRLSKSTNVNHDIHIHKRASINSHIKVEYSASTQTTTVYVNGVAEQTSYSASNIANANIGVFLRLVDEASLKFKNFIVYSINQ